MSRDIIVSRKCTVGPNGYFRPGVGPAEDGSVFDGAVVVSLDFARPEPDADDDPALFPTYWCEYSIRYGDVAIRIDKDCGMDATGALLAAIRMAVHRMDLPAFDAIDGSGRFGNVIPYLDAIPREWFEDMRYAGSDPEWTAEERVVFQHADGRRAYGRIALGYPKSGYDEHKPWCVAKLDGIDADWRVGHIEGDTPFNALHLAIASLAARLRTFIADGGRVLDPDGDRDVDLTAFFGKLAP
jgi:hypothetical protein